jgi:hypothetical protein
LLPTAPRRKYEQRASKDRSVLHWGQRRVLFSEVEFLLDYGKPGDVLVYAGAAPGQHTNYLARMLPEVDYALVDPNDFMAQDCTREEGMTGAVRVRQEVFTDEVAMEYADKVLFPENVLFVSDIRTANHKDMQGKEAAEHLDWDNAAQMRWHDLIRPRRSML